MPGTSACVLRPAVAADAAQIAALYLQLTGNPAVKVLPERISALHARDDVVLWVAELAGEVCATALQVICADVMFGSQPFALIENFVVAESLRGQGIGRRLLAAIERDCAARQCSKIMLLSAQQRPAAHRFYERAGYAGDAKRGFVKYRRQFTAS
ncbi:GNAT family N-acetyltransferase [Uliginosibacterium sediminicola]|uniref:GNAT family N-acetyltransferase n=1 Tax=Uliginosibacterium sediminicola TaxID=2024550 RepID=A0ABU9YXV8_9RHOO